MDTRIRKITYSETDIETYEKQLTHSQDKLDKKYLLDYPTVYIIHDKQYAGYHVYVGETNNIIGRTEQHLKEIPTNDINNYKQYWNSFNHSKKSKMYVIGNDKFNKSLTLDVENKLMSYLTSVPVVYRVENARPNAQENYFTKNDFDKIFSDIWSKLGKDNPHLFPSEKEIKDSAIFKASPFHELTQEQEQARKSILRTIQQELNKGTDEIGRLKLVMGEAGSGKTVLLSNIFLDISDSLKDFNNDQNTPNFPEVHLLVNHNEQLSVYTQIANKLGLQTRTHQRVWKPTAFLNKHLSSVKKEQKPVDVVIVDEAHLLLTQGDQGYHGKDHLVDLLKVARVVVAVFDQDQILSTKQWRKKEEIERYLKDPSNDLIRLQNQLRINANDDTLTWLRNFIDNGDIGPIPEDEDYDLQIFDTPDKLYHKIRERSEQTESGLSRVIATYDWPWKENKKPDNGDFTWNVTVGNFSMPWNYSLPCAPEDKDSSWAEQPQTIDEIGSTFTIQGFDLNIAGVIIGRSVKWDETKQKVYFDREESCNKGAKNRRTLSDNTKAYLSDELLHNELNVLLTRGVNGLYIFAVDKPLRQHLLAMSRQTSPKL
ncbi:DUF2075 domain-containing protein [Corynebacterium kroppenstedtii]|uniref:DUF2075 domain-containing protein n=1 Tax=Corynebacterium kroppenstedtii TaxID=161879 RepID=UPI00264F4DF3|nr:DNA/RNA helicase domain-containing protein [Corynebacterium kroppenstedtii]MDN8624456.1 DUF2075 domain-containing protein [Corynebacterium kroppenstedtii]